MLDDLLRFKKKQKYLLYDFETESLNLYYSRPWQLSFVIGQGNQTLEEHDYFIDIPDLKVSDEAAKVTNFSWERYNKLKRPKEEVLEVFDKYLYDSDYIVCGHNILNFDTYIHTTLRRICGKKEDYSYLERLIDTNCLAKAIKCEIEKPKDEEMIQWMFRLASFRKRGVKTNLKALLKEYDIEFDEKMLHNSLFDIRYNYLLLSKLLWNINL